MGKANISVGISTSTGKPRQKNSLWQEVDFWSAQELSFLDMWRTFPGIWAVSMMRLGRVSGEEQSELYCYHSM